MRVAAFQDPDRLREWLLFKLPLFYTGADLRGWADPEYAGFSVGLLQASQGPMVTLVAGSLFLAALAAACIVVLNRVGRAMWLPTVVDGFLALNFAIILIGGHPPR